MQFGGVLILVVSLQAATFVGMQGADSGADRGDPVAEPASGEILTSRNTGPAATSASQRRALFGDLHVHTQYSIDSYLFGNRNGPRDAYRFARGRPLNLVGNRVYQLDRPLDFAAVTDHASGLADWEICVGDPNNAGYPTKWCQQLRSGDNTGFSELFELLAVVPPKRPASICPEGGRCRESAKGPWEDVQAAAEEYYEPGVFTTFVAYEWTPTLPGRGHLHRNVIFANEHVPDEALSVYDAPYVADLWRWLESACTGRCDVLAIPHNTNFSWGLTFASRERDGTPYTDADWRRRARYERLVEIFQHKGASECAFGVGGEDELCHFEQIFPLCKDDADLTCARFGSFARDGLKIGMDREQELGYNPMQFGFIGSTDTHNAIPGAVEESSFRGHSGLDADVGSRMYGVSPTNGLAAAGRNPGGLAGVWAEANTREAIFAALKRRETFATSGPRILPRLFAGWPFEPDLLEADDPVAAAYAQGVPMGGELGDAAADQSPGFFIWASRDPKGRGLQLAQIVKIWVKDGTHHERIYDVACARDQKPDRVSGRCPESPAGVDLETCEPTGPDGAAALKTIWKDPEFDSESPAAYYLRVIEEPSCRWSTWTALQRGLQRPQGVPPTIRERAWTSPIWYSPER